MPGYRLKLTPLSIVLFYACIGGVWLLLIFSRFIGFLFHAPGAVELLEINNAVFIIVTAWLLYILIRKSESGIKQRKEALTRLNRSLKAYSECHQALIRANDEMHLMHNICRTIVEVGGYRVAWVGVAERDVERSIRPVAQWGDKNDYLKNLQVSWANTDRGRGPTGTAIKSGKPVVAQYIEYDPRWELWREQALQQGFLSSISVPLMDQGSAFAALVIFSGEPRAFDDEEVKLLTELADDLSYGILTLRAGLERKRVEKERRLLASVIEQAREGILLFDGEGVIRYVNPAVETITGHAPAEMVEHNIHTLEYQEPNKTFYEAILKAISHGKENAGRFPYRRKDGVMFELDLVIWSVIDASGITISYAALLRDITHEMQLERQLRQAQRMEAIGTLAGGIAHDFNNTLASIITCTELALDEASESSELKELLDVVLKSGLRGKNLVKQILTFSRQGEQEKQEVQVELIVGECLKLLRASSPASIEIRLSLGEELGLVFADPTQIHQIVMNLCTNAMHAMRGLSSGVLEIGLETVDVDCNISLRCHGLTPGPYLRLSVTDTGHGMTPETMERIFDPFFTTKGQMEGTGLGLSVIHGIVNNHGGSITVESEVGLGSTFTVYLPSLPAAVADKVEESAAIDTTGTESILLVDDEEDLVFAAQRMLKQLGYKVFAWTDPRKALVHFQEQPHCFDLVITDHNMPCMNGIDLAREITLVRPELPVILCTGYDLMPIGSITGAEPAACITELALKPLAKKEMAALVRRVLNDARGGGSGSDGQDLDN